MHPRLGSAIVFLLLGPACTRDGALTKLNSLPEAQILSPSPGSAVVEGRTVSLRGQASDPNHAASELLARWFVNGAEACPTSTPGADGATACDTVIPDADAVEVRLEVLDPEGAAAVATANFGITQNVPPEVTLQSPILGGSYYSDQLITLSGMVADADDALDTLTIWWEDGAERLETVDTDPSGSGEVMGYTFLAEGPHALELHALDAAGNEAVEGVVIDVGPPNSAPSCAIVSPFEGGSSAYGQRLELGALVGDADITADRLQVEWSSDRDGALGTSLPDTDGTVTYTTGVLSANAHRIVLRVTDEVGATCTDSIGWTVSTPPSVEFLEPTDGETVNEGDPISFVALAADVEDPATDLVVTWESDIDGALAVDTPDSTGTSAFVTAGMTAGEHTVTVTVTDTAGLTTAARRTVVVNDLPTAPVVTIAPAAPYGNDDLVARIDVPATDSEGDPLTYTYAWYRDGARSGASATDTLPASATTRGEVWSVEVWANDGMGDGLRGSASVTILDTAPTVAAVTLSPSSARTDDTLACVVAGASDADGESVLLAYAWTVNGAALSETASTLDGAWFVRGDTVACTATPSAGSGTGSSMTSAPVAIVNTAPAMSGASITPGTPSRSATLACVGEGATDADGDTVTMDYAWELDGVAVGTGSTLAGPFTPGAVATCTVTPHDGTDAGAVVAASVTIVNEAPVVTSVGITPAAPDTDDVLTASATTFDADGDTLTLAYAWYVDGALVAETGPTLDGSVWFARDQVVHVEVTASDADGAGASTASSAVTVANSAPSAPGVTLTPDDAVDGDDLLCVVSTAATDIDGDALTYVFAWDVDGVAYTGATSTGTSSTVPGADVGAEETWTCTVVASDGTDTGPSASDSVTTGTGEPTWTAVWSHPLSSTPSGTIALTGAHMGQGAASVYGRTAWIQRSDWNVIYVPVTRSSTTLEAVEAEVYAPSYGHAALYARSAKYGYNGASNYIAWWENPSTGFMGAGYGGWYDGCCASSGTVDLTTSLRGYTTGAWHTVRIEQDFMSNEARFLLDGVEIYTTTAVPLTSLSTNYVQLRGGGPRSWASADVAWSNLIVYEGTR